MPRTVRNNQAPHTTETLWTHYSGTTPTMAVFCKVTPAAIWGGSANARGFTSHTRDVTLSWHGGLTFKSAPGLSPTVVEVEAGIAPPNLEITAIFNATDFSETDLLAGKWDHAEIEIWLMNWETPAMGEIVIHSGYLGEMRDYQNFFRAEVRGRNSLVHNNFGKLTSALCRVKNFRDAECGLTATVTSDGFNIVATQTVTIQNTNSEFTVSRTQAVPDGFYNNGKITGLTGLNAGLSREIKVNWTGPIDILIWLKRPFPFNVLNGATFSLEAGCDRTLDRCKYFANVINRRAEDFIPGIENAMRVPPDAQ